MQQQGEEVGLRLMPGAGGPRTGFTAVVQAGEHGGVPGGSKELPADGSQVPRHTHEPIATAEVLLLISAVTVCASVAAVGIIVKVVQRVELDNEQDHLLCFGIKVCANSKMQYL